jgi:hypothetical protein
VANVYVMTSEMGAQLAKCELRSINIEGAQFVPARPEWRFMR